MNNKNKNAITIILSGLLCVLFLTVAMKLWEADFQYAFCGTYGAGDGTIEQMGIQNLVESGSRNLTDRLGGTNGQQLYNYPTSDALNYFIMFFFSLFTKNSAMIQNLFFLVTFPLAAMSATAALLGLRITNIPSLFLGILYAFMPYHFLRNQQHLLLSGYYLVPLAIMVVLWLMNQEIIREPLKKLSFREAIYNNRSFLLSLVICFLISSTGIYYAYFTAFFLLLAIVKSIFDDRRWSKNSTTGLVLLFTVFSGVVLNYLPTFIFRLSGGEASDAFGRSGVGAEIYGLKLIDLFMPTVDHRIPIVSELVSKFHATEPIANENIFVSLGVLGSFGLIALLFLPILDRAPKLYHSRLLRNAAIMSYAAFILATTGGISAVICRLVLNQIRAYNRICVFLFFLALFTVSVFLQYIWSRFVCRSTSEEQNRSAGSGILQSGMMHLMPRKIIYLLAVLLVMGFSLFDQTPLGAAFPYEANRQMDNTFISYFGRIEESMPTGAYIYQLPYVVFPEPEVVYGNGPYAHLLGYLNTENLHWSYGALGGTSSDKWAKTISQLPAEDMMTALRSEGYRGVLIDLKNYPDTSLVELKDKILSITGADPIISEDGQLVFIDISE